MNYTEMLAEVSKETGVKRDDVKAVVEKTLSKISLALKTEKKVALPDFGTFEAVVLAPRQARNPQTGEVFQVGERRRVKFRSRIEATWDK